MTRTEACALCQGDYVKFSGSDQLLRVIQPARPKYVLLQAPDGATEIPHVMYMEQYTFVGRTVTSRVSGGENVQELPKPLKLSGESVIIPLDQSREAEVSNEG